MEVIFEEEQHKNMQPDITIVHNWKESLTIRKVHLKVIVATYQTKLSRLVIEMSKFSRRRRYSNLPLVISYIIIFPLFIGVQVKEEGGKV